MTARAFLYDLSVPSLGEHKGAVCCAWQRLRVEGCRRPFKGADVQVKDGSYRPWQESQRHRSSGPYLVIYGIAGSAKVFEGAEVCDLCSPSSYILFSLFENVFRRARLTHKKWCVRRTLQKFSWFWVFLWKMSGSF